MADKAFPLTVEMFIGDDSAAVVQVDGTAPRVRVNLNDGTLWDGDPEGPKTSDRERVRRALRENVETVIETVADLLVLLGANREWSSDVNWCTSEALAILARTAGLPTVSDQDPAALAFWREVADELSIEHDGEDES